MNEQQVAHLATVPASAAGIIERAYRRTGGRSNAIKAMCLQCTGYDRKTIKECTTGACALHSWRPFQPAVKTTDPAAQQQVDPADEWDLDAAEPDVQDGPPEDWDPDLDGPWPPQQEPDDEDDEL